MTGLDKAQQPRRQKLAADTRLIGFFRWVERGAKPEFVGITRLKQSGSQVRGEKKEVMTWNGSRPVIQRIADLENIVEQVRSCAKPTDRFGLSTIACLHRLAEIARLRDTETGAPVARSLADWLDLPVE